MNRSSISGFLIFPILLALTLSFHGVNGGPLEDNCKTLASIGLPYNSCVTNLQADPRSKNADLYELGLISLNLTRANAAYIKARAQKLLNDQGRGADIRIKRVLQACVHIYFLAIEDTNDGIKSFVSKGYSGTRNSMSGVADSGGTCEDGFIQFNFTSPLTKENNNFLQMADIPLTIAYWLECRGTCT
ncbi:hypothetical protein IFM89_016534 [Coptis chinensis]|uniref:Pectinesterase inhibitor domain-containing protein n=1 Tax=Coptis chinensis TaxID=261450 RepID=A0A835M6J5_9MAGN|nr:hypothetical protein IFM89_016534 [Coptis chinensis]